MFNLRNIITAALLTVFSVSQLNAATNTCNEVRKIFNTIDKDGSGTLTNIEFSARPFPDREYTLKHYTALEAQIIYSDKNMDGSIQPSEYENLITKGSFHESKPAFSELTKRNKLDYCELSTRMGVTLAHKNFSSRDANKDNMINFSEYVANYKQCQQTK